MRISKEPEVRKQEMIDTAMKIFAQKGYEATSMTDIAKEMNVVSGLCYRYFKSKNELYETAVKMYAKACSEPMIQILSHEGMTLQEGFERFSRSFIVSDGAEKYHEFFHREGSERFHRHLESEMLKNIMPHMIKYLADLRDRGEIQIDDIENSAKFIMYGQMPIINDEQLSSKEKTDKVIYLIKKVLA